MVNQIKNIFPIIDDIICSENFNSFEIKYKTNLDNFEDENKINLSFNDIPDDWILTINIENFDIPIQLTDTKKTKQFIDNLKKEKQTIESETITLKLNLNKKKENNQILIYNQESFFEYIKSQTVTDFLNSLASSFSNSDSIHFKCFDSDIETSFHTKYIYYSHPPKSKLIKLKLVSENCHYVNRNDYPFSPEHFIILTNTEEENPFTKKIRLCNMVFNIISLADYTEIKDNKLYYKIIGYRTFEGVIECDKISLTPLETYNEIFNWVYSEKGKVNDKLGLSRNILSVYLKKNSLEIEEDAFFSIQSGYKTYLQQNLNKYIDLRGKITDQLESINQKANSILEQVLNNYQKSNFAFISFFISIFVLRVLIKGNFENVFTKDATVILIILIIISGIYLAYSLWLFNSEKSRLEKKYSYLKQRFEDLLIKDDINKILRDDKEFNSEIAYIKKRRNVYTILWVATIVLFLILLLELSSYFNWQTINEYINKIFE